MSNHDSAGRPIVVVTGMGVVTSLGAGKSRELGEAHRRQVGHQEHHPLPDRRAEDAFRRHGRFRHGRAFVVAGIVRAAGRSCRRGSRRASPASAAAAISRARCFIAVPPIEIEWEQRRQVAAASGANASVSYDDLYPHGGRGQVHAVSRALHVRLGRRSSGRQVSAPRARRFRSRPPARPARPQSSSASRRSAAAKPTPRSASARTARSTRSR